MTTTVDVPAAAVGDTVDKPSASAEGKPAGVCPVCALPMPPGAQKCTECDEWRSWRRFVPASQTGLSLLLALISIVTIVGPPFIRWMYPNSETHIYIVPADENVIQAAVSNVGRRPAVLRSYWVSFDHPDFPERTEMGLTSGKSVLLPDQNDVVSLNLRLLPIPKAHQDDIARWIKTGHVTVLVSVKESNNVKANDETPRKDIIEARYLADWITNHIQWTD